MTAKNWTMLGTLVAAFAAATFTLTSARQSRSEVKAASRHSAPMMALDESVDPQVPYASPDGTPKGEVDLRSKSEVTLRR